MRILISSLVLLFGVHAYAEDKTRIVSIGGANTEIICALDACDKLVATDTSSTFPDSLSKLPKVGYARNLSAEGIVALKPTLIILDDEAGPPHVIKQLEALKIPMKKVQSGVKLDEARTRMKEIAAALGVPDKGEKIVKDFDARIASLSKFQNEKVKKRILFIYARGGKHLMVAGDNTPISVLLNLVGAENAVKGVDGFKPLTAEAVAAAKPDLIMMTESGAESLGGLDGVLSLPGVKLTPAGEKKQLYLDNDLRLLTIGPRTGDVVEAIHSKIGTKG